MEKIIEIKKWKEKKLNKEQKLLIKEFDEAWENLVQSDLDELDQTGKGF